MVILLTFLLGMPQVQYFFNFFSSKLHMGPLWDGGMKGFAWGSELHDQDGYHAHIW